MKRLKKTLALALALILALAMSTAVFADENGGETITNYITISDAPSNHTYVAYQIFTGNVSGNATSGYTLSNVKYGNGISKIGDNPVTVGAAATTDADTLAQKNIESEKDMIAYINTLTFTENSFPFTETKGESTSTYTTGEIPAGYYVVKDVSTTVGEGEEYSSYIVKVVGSVDAKAKVSETTSQKKVMDINDSIDEENEWQDSADYDIGDAVPFQLKAKITDWYDAYTTYYLAFHDTEQDGLTFNKDSVVVYIDGQEVDAKSYTILTATEGNTLKEKETFDIVFEDLKNTSAKAGSTITVEYTSTLNKKANIGKDGNKNTMYLEYSNNPNVTGDGTTGTTPEDTVIVFTYKLVIDKIDGKTNQALSGAVFTLYKRVGTELPSVFPEGVTEADYVKKDDGNYYQKIGYKETAEGTTQFTFEGIDDGTYILSETKTPNGYNTMDDVTFNVVATHGNDNAGKDALTLISLTGDKTTGETYFTQTEDYLYQKIANNQGSKLPSTGGTGRVLLYVVGAILVVGVGVILVSKKRAQQ